MLSCKLRNKPFQKEVPDTYGYWYRHNLTLIPRHSFFMFLFPWKWTLLTYFTSIQQWFRAPKLYEPYSGVNETAWFDVDKNMFIQHKDPLSIWIKVLTLGRLSHLLVIPLLKVYLPCSAAFRLGQVWCLKLKPRILTAFKSKILLELLWCSRLESFFHWMPIHFLVLSKSLGADLLSKLCSSFYWVNDVARVQAFGLFPTVDSFVIPISMGNCREHFRGQHLIGHENGT